MNDFIRDFLTGARVGLTLTILVIAGLTLYTIWA